MAGSYLHAVTDDGKLRRDQSMSCENLGDAFETIEEMYGMIWWLANGNAFQVEQAQAHYRDGLAVSPGVEEEE